MNTISFKNIRFNDIFRLYKITDTLLKLVKRTRNISHDFTIFSIRDSTSATLVTRNKAAKLLLERVETGHDRNATTFTCKNAQKRNGCQDPSELHKYICSPGKHGAERMYLRVESGRPVAFYGVINLFKRH